VQRKFLISLVLSNRATKLLGFTMCTPVFGKRLANVIYLRFLDFDSYRLWGDYMLAGYILICSPLKYKLLGLITFMSFQASEDWCFDVTAYFFLYVKVTYGPFARHS